MATGKYISKNSDRQFGSDFLELKKRGLEHIQDLSGELWTDYNHHDPGITILEQVCYALTETAYQEDLDISDLLTEKTAEEPDYESLGLFLPNLSFSMHALKPADYSRMFYDKIDGVVNAWLEPVTSKVEAGGLYHLYLNIIDNDAYKTPNVRTRIVNEAIDIYNSNRNLGEDLDSITILEYKDVNVKTKIILDTVRNPAEVMAEIILKIEECVTPRMQFVPLDKLQQDGYSQDRIFEGPRLINGIIPVNTYKKKPGSVDSNEVSEYILRVPDVDSVRSLYFMTEGDKFSRITIEKNKILRYNFDIINVMDNIEIYQKGSGRKMIVDPELLDRHYRIMRTALRRTLPVKNLDLKPAQNQKPVNEPAPYYSIQHDFPTIYGINKYGVPSHESDIRKAQALQLKAYLYFFEQILADGMELPRSLKSLFSTKSGAKSYPFTFLDESNIPGITKLYDDIGSGVETFRDKLVKMHNQYDNYTDRKSRAIDYMISLYGESCSLYSVSQFNYYYSDTSYKTVLLELKQQFLDSIADLNYNRSGAFNYLKLSGDTDLKQYDNVSGMEKKARLLLGITRKDRNTRERSCRSGFELYGLKLKSTSSIEHADCYSDNSKGEGLIEINYNSRGAELYFSSVNFLEDMTLGEEECTELLKETRIFIDGVLDDELLKSGISLKNYRVGQITSEGVFQVLLKSRYKSENVWRKLGNVSNAKKACDLVLAHLQRFRELSIMSEDFLVLEHILLRPVQADDLFVEWDKEDLIEHYSMKQKERALASESTDVTQDFFSHRLSIFLPSWTARFSDPGYRSLVSETFNLLIPAHMVCDMFWLSPEEMCDFENRYNKWISQKSNRKGDNNTLDDLSEELIIFIRNQTRKKGGYDLK